MTQLHVLRLVFVLTLASLLVGPAFSRDNLQAIREEVRTWTPAGIRAAVRAGASLGREEFGGSPLMRAAGFHSDPAVISTLLELRSDEYVLRDRSGTTALHYAASNAAGDGFIELLVNVGISIDERDNYGHTPLLAAAFGNPNLAVIDLLLALGADPLAVTDRGETALMRAASNENPAVFERFLALGVDPNARDEDGETAFFKALIYNDNPAVVRLLLGLDPVLNITNAHGLTTLHAAALGSSADQAIFELILASGVDVNARRTRDGVTAMMHVAKRGDVKLLELLLAAGADVNAVDGNGRTPLLHAANEHLTLELWEWFVSAGADPLVKTNYGSTVLMLAARNADVGVVERILAVGVGVNDRDDWGSTALFDAVYGDADFEVVRVLYEAGGDVSAVMDDGATLLLAAALVGSLDVVEWLLGFGLAVNVENELGRTPLMVAAFSADPRVVAALVVAGADVHARDSFGMTALMMAADLDAGVEALRVLLAAGSDVNARNASGESPLFLLSGYTDSVESIVLLLDAGANVDSRTLRGETPLMVAARGNDNPFVLDALLDGGAEVNLRDLDGKRAVDYAEGNGALVGTDSFWRLWDASFE